MHCPDDRAALSHAMLGAANVWRCRRCDGRAVGIAVLKHTLERQAMNALWQASATAPVGTRPCPSCRFAMRAVPVPLPEGHVEIDVCRTCHVAWLDSHELPQLKAPEVLAEAKVLGQPRRRSVVPGLPRAHPMVTQTSDGHVGAAAPAEAWKLLPAIFGIPVEYEPQVFERLPVLTWLLVVVTCVVSIAAFGKPEAFFLDWGFVPARAMAHGGLTLLTSFFLHGGWLHLVGNMYFLLFFGDNVEDYLGKTRYLLLLVLASVTGCALHFALDPRSDLPLVGASGAISGVIAFYALHLPRARLGIFLVLFPIFFRWIYFPAWVGALLWAAQQAFGAMAQMHGQSSVSALGHLGGAAAGVIFWLLFRQRLKD